MSEAAYVLDASALLCVIHQEPGAQHVQPKIAGARISAVNLAEVLSKLIDKGLDGERSADLLEAMDLEVVAFDQAHARLAARLRRRTRRAGLSLADRACLALAEATGGIALTADRAWARLALGIQVEVFR